MRQLLLLVFMLSSMLLRAQSLSKIDSLQHEIIQLQQQLGRVKPMLPVARGVMIPTESLNGAFTYTYANAIGVAGEPVQKGNSVTVNLAEPLQGQPTIIATFATDPYAPVPIVPQITYHQTSDRSVTFEFTAITIEGKPYPQITSEMSFVIFDAPKD